MTGSAAAAAGGEPPPQSESGCWLPDLAGPLLVPADFCDQHVLTRELGVPVRTYLGLNSTLATAALATLTWLTADREHHAGGTRPVPTDGWYSPTGTAAATGGPAARDSHAPPP